MDRRLRRSGRPLLDRRQFRHFHAPLTQRSQIFIDRDTGRVCKRETRKRSDKQDQLRTIIAIGKPVLTHRIDFSTWLATPIGEMIGIRSSESQHPTPDLAAFNQPFFTL